jgi:crotonobetainyl-CoA:carnitine CoA-transferase CaiB-like acyl-CoA transferase
MPAPPLTGTLVVALEQAVAAPFATRQLADLGARVIKVERPAGGDFARGYDTTVSGLSSHFVWLNRGKESLTLDLKRQEARLALFRLLERADVFVQNLAPGAAERLDLSAETLRRNHPRLITCSLTGYGTTGPYASKKAYDLLIQSEVGLLSITGTEDTPSKVGVSVADIAGGMYAYSGILAAMLQRGVTGEGVALEISLFDALGEWMGYPMYYTLGGSAPPRAGASHATIAPYGPYETKDGSVVFAIHNRREWNAFCSIVLKRSELSEDPRFQTNELRVENRAAMDSAILEVLRRLTASEVIERLDQAEIANARMNSVSQFIQHPQFAARGSWRRVDSPAGSVPALIPPVRMAGVDPIMRAIPELGQHTEAILAEIGFDAGTLTRWKDERVF